MTRWMQLMLAVAIGVGMGGGCGAASPRAGDAAKEIERLEAVLTEVDAHLAALPPDQRLTAWRTDYGMVRPAAVLIGERYGYYHWTRSRFILKRDGPSVDDQRPILNDSHPEYDQVDLVTCVDLQTGKQRWTRRLSGPFRYFLGPDDHLLAQASRLIQLDRDSGEVMLDQPIGPKWHEVGGVMMNRRHFMHELVRQGAAAEQPMIFDVDAGAVIQLAYRPTNLSPNRLRTLRTTVQAAGWRGSTTVSSTTLDGKSIDWTYQEPVNSASEATWFEGDALLLSGTFWKRSLVTRFDKESGAVKWTHRMPNGAWEVGGGVASDSRVYYRRWPAVGELAGHVAAIGGQAEVHLIDGQTGRRVAIFSRPATHLAFPRQVGDNIIFADHDAFVAVPMKVVLGQQETEAKLRVRMGRALLMQQRIAAARELAEALVREAPDAADAWDLRAEVAEVSDDPATVAAARVRAMQIRDQQRSPPLLASHGLVGRIDTGAIRAQLALLPPVVFAGTIDGALLRIDPYSAEVAARVDMGEVIDRMAIVGSTLFRGTDAGDAQQVATVIGQPAPPVWPDPGYRFPLPPDAAPPVAWHTRPDQPTSDLHFNGRSYRPLPNGQLRIVEGANESVRQSPIEGLAEWHLYHGPGGLLGYGRGGVYRLDESLVPVERIIDVGGEASANQRYRAMMIASDGQTLAILVQRSHQTAVQIWSIDGQRKLREEAIAVHARDRVGFPGRLIHLDGGYFFSGRELAWIPIDSQRPAWRFGAPMPPMLQITPDPRHFCGFGIPRLLDERLVVAWEEGDIFIFDTGRITAAPE